MTIRKKVESKDLDKVIEKGGHVAADKESKGKWHNFTLRIKSEMLVEVEQAVERMAGLTKTGFILQAIQEKLKRTE